MNVTKIVTHTHDHIHLHGIHIDNLVVIIIGYTLLGIALLVIVGLIVYGIKERNRLRNRYQMNGENISLDLY